MTRLDAIAARDAGKSDYLLEGSRTLSERLRLAINDRRALLGMVRALAETLGEIAVHEGNPALEVAQMRSAARVALATLEVPEEER